MSRSTRKLLCLAVSSALVVGLVQVVSIVAAPHAATALASPASGTGGQFVPVQGRILDTRAASQVGPYGTAMPAGTWRTVPVQGVAGIPTSGVSAVAVTLTVLNPAGAGLLHADKDESTPNSTVTYMNYAAGVQESNTATLAVADDGKIQVVATSATDMLIDVQGYYTADDTVAPGGYVPVTPKRLVDTSAGTGLPQHTLAGGSTTTVQVTNSAGIPAGATGVMLNFTVAHNTATGSRFFTPYPADEDRPSASMNFSGAVDATGAQVGLSTSGTPMGAFKFFLSGSGYTIDLIVDIVGYFASGTSTGAYTPAIARVWDSRTTGHSTLASGASISIPVAGVNGIPQPGSGISSVTTNLAVISGGTNAGYLSMFASGTSRPTPFSTINYQPSVYTSNMATSALGTNGAVTIYNSGPDAVNFVVDLEGWYTSVGGAIGNGQTQTQQSVTLQANPNGGGAWVSYQYRTGTTGSFAAVPTANLTDTNGNHPSGTTSQKTSGAFPAYTWNIRDTLTVGNIPAPDSLVQVQACYGTSSNDANPACGMPSDVDFAQAAFSAAFATAPVGPGTLAELTGDYEVSATDANATSSLGGLSVGRTLTTLTPPNQSGAAGVFGPGWTADLTGPAAGQANVTPIDDSAQGYILLTATDGTQTTYSQDVTNTQRFVGADTNAGDSSVVTRTSSNTIILTDADGTTTTWTKTSAGWRTASVVAPGSNSTTTYTYDGNGRVTRILAPVPAGIGGCSAPDTTPGCRSLILSYGSVAGATRLTSIALSIPQTSATANIVPIASYDYDAEGRLAHAWDPRITPALKTAYTYDSGNRLATLTPPGLAAWSLAFDPTSHRLLSVSRPDPSGAAATTTIEYGVSTTGGGSTGLPMLGGTTPGQWGQSTDLPVTGTAIFDPDHNPGGTVSAADWPYATIDYLDVNGRTVNTATYGAGAWQIDTTQYDDIGNEIWSLTAGNRAQALAPTVDTDPYVAANCFPSASNCSLTNYQRAALLASTTVYDPLNPANITDTFGPTHPVTLSDGSIVDARSHVQTSYDEGAPNNNIDPATTEPYNLPTTVTTTAYQPAIGKDTTWPDAQIARTGYAPINSGDTSGWILGVASSSTTQMTTSPTSADLITSTRYDSNGRVIEQRLPNDGAGNSPRTTLTSYYTATGTGGCVDATRVGLVCTRSPAAQPGRGNPLPTTSYTYDQYGKITTKTETFGSGASQITRTTNVGYDSAEREVSSSITTTPTSAGGTVLPAKIFGYDPATGLQTTISTSVAGVRTAVTTGFDALGRKNSYTDANGTVSTIGYDLAGKITSKSDGKATTSFTVDSSTEHRGFTTSEDVGVTGSPSVLTASYDPAGNLAVETYPNGLTATRAYDNAKNLISLVYAKAGSTWMTFAQGFDVFGRIAHQSSPRSAQNLTYDPDNRLTTVQDTYQGSCTTRAYAFDTHGNRTSLSSYPASSGNGCSTNTTPSSSTYNYDDADRLLNDSAGAYTYDALGRAMKIPAGDAIGTGGHAGITGDVSVSYYANDMVANEAQGSANQAFTLDPTQTRINTSSDGTRTTTNHFGSDVDSPTWTSTSETVWTRNLLGIDGGLAATVNQDGTVVLQLSNLHGDLVATAPDTTNAAAVSSYGETTEYGQPRDVASAPTPYGYLGTKERSTDSLGGLILMGVRLYSPSTGRFSSVDSVSQGNANAYVYPDDPINSDDASGMTNNVTGHHCTWTHCDFRYSNRRALKEADMLNQFALYEGGAGTLAAIFSFAGGPAAELLSLILSVSASYLGGMAARITYLVHRYHRGIFFRVYYWGSFYVHHQ